MLVSNVYSKMHMASRCDHKSQLQLSTEMYMRVPRPAVSEIRLVSDSLYSSME